MYVNHSWRLDRVPVLLPDECKSLSYIPMNTRTSIIASSCLLSASVYMEPQYTSVRPSSTRTLCIKQYWLALQDPLQSYWLTLQDPFQNYWLTLQDPLQSCLCETLKDVVYLTRVYFLHSSCFFIILRFDIRVMQSGRMKGQAFVGLPSEQVAITALQETHGYLLHGKPLVVVSTVLV